MPAPQLIHDISVGNMESCDLSWPWSHQGDRLAYSVSNNAANTTSLFIYKLATPNQPVEVTGPFARGTFISRSMWSRDDARLAFKTFQAGCSSELYTNHQLSITSFSSLRMSVRASKANSPPRSLSDLV